MLSFTRRTLGVALAAAAFGFVGVGAPREAQADATGPKAEILIVHATNCDKPNPNPDPVIGEIPPLKYNCYTLKGTRELTLSTTAPATTELPNGRTFQMTYKGVGADKRYGVMAAISKPDKSGFLPVAEVSAAPNKRFHIGGWAHSGGAIVLIVKIVP